MQQRTHLISFLSTTGKTNYIKSVGRTGSVTVTHDRAKARLFPELQAHQVAREVPVLAFALKVEAA